ncbi:MAG: hypothetical protein QJR07_09280 [Acetobacteraceae bacterium]|nr:hypothetical protein [Acetobacteraceae bacterium]MDI3307283.1 hypothetical protein [Acetobacteraceae bacterium]
MPTLYATTGEDVIRLTSRDGARWEVTTLLAGVGAMCLALDPHDPRRLFVGTFDRGLLRSHDGGARWEPVGDGSPHPRVLSVAISPADRPRGLGVVLAGTEPSALFRSEDDGRTWQELAALRALPSAPTWSFPPRPWTSHVRWIAPDWSNPHLLFAGIELGGVMRSTDGGQTWEDRKPGSYHDAHAILTHPSAPGRVYEAAGGGVAASDDAGVTWRPVDEGMDRHYVWGLAVDPADPDLWYVSATFSARHAHSRHGQAEAIIYRRRGAEPWQALGGGLPSPLPVMPYALVAPPDRPGELYAGMQDGQLSHSADRGDSWRRLEVALPALLALVAAPA